MGAGPAAAATAGRRRLCRQPAAALSAAGKGHRAPRLPEEAAEDDDEGERRRRRRGAAALPPAPPPRPAVSAPALAPPLPPPGPAGLRAPSRGAAVAPRARRSSASPAPRAHCTDKQTDSRRDGHECVGRSPALYGEAFNKISEAGAALGLVVRCSSVSGRPRRAVVPVTQHRAPGGTRGQSRSPARRSRNRDTAPLAALLLPW